MDQFRGYTVAGMFLVNFRRRPERVRSADISPTVCSAYRHDQRPQLQMSPAGFSVPVSRLATRLAGCAAPDARPFPGLEYRPGAALAGQNGGIARPRPGPISHRSDRVGGLLKVDLWEVLVIIGVPRIRPAVMPLDRGSGPSPGSPGVHVIHPWVQFRLRLWAAEAPRRRWACRGGRGMAVSAHSGS